MLMYKSISLTFDFQTRPHIMLMYRCISTFQFKQDHTLCSCTGVSLPSTSDKTTHYAHVQVYLYLPLQTRPHIMRMYRSVSLTFHFQTRPHIMLLYRCVSLHHVYRYSCPQSYTGNIIQKTENRPELHR